MKRQLAVAGSALLFCSSILLAPLALQGQTQSANRDCTFLNGIVERGQRLVRAYPPELNPAVWFEVGYATASMSLIPASSRALRPISVKEFVAALEVKCSQEPRDRLVDVARWIITGQIP